MADIGPDEITPEQLESLRGTILMDGHVKILNPPSWQGGQWVCLAQVGESLCLVSIRLFKKEA